MSPATSPLAWARWVWMNLRPGLAALLILASAATFVLYVAQEPAVRIWGLVLQLLGIGAVVHELRSTTRHYGRHGIRDSVRRAWRSRPGSPTLLRMNVGVGLGAVVVKMQSVKLKVGGDLTVERRLELLEDQASAFDVRLDSADEALREERAQREKGDKAEAEARAAALTTLDGRVEEVVAGSVPVSLLGVWSLLTGVVLASAAPELLALRSWLLGG